MSYDIPSDVVEHLRAKLRHGMAGSGHVPADKLDEVVDLAIHAAISASNSCARIALDTSPDFRIGLAAFGPALSILLDLTNNRIASLKEYGAKQGLPVREIKLQMGTMQ